MTTTGDRNPESTDGAASLSGFARETIRGLGLHRHPEGGWYRRDWQSPRLLDGTERPLASMIYFLLPRGEASAWHRVDADEIWLWHGPSTVSLQLGGNGPSPAPDGARSTVTLGAGLMVTDPRRPVPAGHAVVPAGVWQKTLPGSGDALVTCVVSPGFTFEGFTLA